MSALTLHLLDALGSGEEYYHCLSSGILQKSLNKWIHNTKTTPEYKSELSHDFQSAHDMSQYDTYSALIFPFNK